ncbi:MAG: porin [Gemmatimonadota bacterium]
MILAIRCAPLALLLLTFALPASAQRRDDRPSLRFSGSEITLGGRVQTQLNTTSIDTEPTSQLVIRRARLELAIRVNERISGTINPDFAGDEVSLKDAYLNVAFDGGLQFRFGNMYRPFGLLEQTSSKRMPPIERGLRIRGVAAADEYAFLSTLDYSNRDIGVQMHGTPDDAPLGFAYALGVFRGPLHGGVGNQDSYQATGRVTLAPVRALRLGAGWSSRDFAQIAGATTSLRRGNAFEVDLEYGAFAPGLHLIAELSHADLDPFTDRTMRGGQAWLAYRTMEKAGPITAWEPIFRLSHAETSSEGAGISAPGGTLLTPGLNIYFDSLNRLMLNYDMWNGEGDSVDANSFKAMFQFAF